MTTRVLFVCSQNRLRSPTAEHVFADVPGLDVSSAGLNHGAEHVLTPDLLAWADVVFVMEKAHLRRLRERFGPHLKRQRLVCLGIPDDYAYLDPRLVALLSERVPRYLPRT